MNPMMPGGRPAPYPNLPGPIDPTAVAGAYPGADLATILGMAEQAGDPREAAESAKQEGPAEEMPELIRLLMGMGLIPPASAGAMPPGMMMPPGATSAPGPSAPVGY